MSIANYSVVGRILAAVQQSRPAPELTRVERVARPGECFELRSTRRAFEPPFATSFHFWAHGLYAFLAEAGRADLFEAVGAHALCEVVEGRDVAPALEILARRLAPSLPQELVSFRVGYRMIDQEVLCSWVAERDDELVALFWARRDWLDSAAPFHLEEREAPDLESDPEATP